MSVNKRNRKESSFEAIHHLYKMRKEITDLLLFDFGYSHEKAVQRTEKQFNKPYEELSENEKDAFNKSLKRMQAFYDWFIGNERDEIMSVMRGICKCVFKANDGIPQYWDELVKRRMLQDEALGLCDDLKQELQYAIETLPVNINKYIRFSNMIEQEIYLIKKWRTSDNRFKKTVLVPPDYRAVSEHDTNFCNVNSNGNANNNTASNENGVRPDFDDVRKPIE